MKKYLVLFLVLLMGVSAFGACSKDEESPERNITVTAEDTVGATESVALEDDAVGTMSLHDPITVIDNEYATLTIDGLEYDEIWGYNIKTSLVNKTADKSLMAMVENLSVRDVQIDAIYYCEAAAGKTAKETVSLVLSDEEAEIIGEELCLS